MSQSSDQPLILPRHGGSRVSWRNALSLMVLLVALYIFLPRIGQFKTSFNVFQHSDRLWLLAAAAGAAATYVSASATYTVLAKEPLRYGRTLLVQFAGMFANRLLPAGIGAISVSYEYLLKSRHDRAQAAAVVLMNNFLGLVGHVLLLGSLLLMTDTRLQPSKLHASLTIFLVAMAALLLAAAVLWPSKLRRKVLLSLKHLARGIVSYRQHPKQLAGGLVFSIGVTLSYGFCLFACERAVGVDLTFVQTLVILTVGLAGGMVSPTPGGLIGTETGLTAGLVLYGVASSDALAAALTYRFLTFWLPLAFGGIAFEVAEKRSYI